MFHANCSFWNGDTELVLSLPSFFLKVFSLPSFTVKLFTILANVACRKGNLKPTPVIQIVINFFRAMALAVCFTFAFSWIWIYGVALLTHHCIYVSSSPRAVLLILDDGMSDLNFKSMIAYTNFDGLRWSSKCNFTTLKLSSLSSEAQIVHRKNIGIWN